MPTLDSTTQDLVKNLVSDILEVGPSSLDGTARFADDSCADSYSILRIATSIERTLGITLTHQDLPRMTSLHGVYGVVGAARRRQG